MSKIGKTTELTDEQLNKISGGKPDWDGNATSQGQNLKSQFSRNNLNMNQKTNFFTKLCGLFGINNNAITNQHSVTNNNSRINNNVNFAGINENENQNQNEN